MGARTKPGKLYVGTSGWSYRWPGFYPKNITSRKYLAYYSEHFNTVEVNYSFYHLPKPSTYEKWGTETPDDFVFALKLSKYITHSKRLSAVKRAYKTFAGNALTLGSKVGPILVQLPPNFKIDNKAIESFLEVSNEVQNEISAHRPLRLAFEFRHKSWFESPGKDITLASLKRYNAAFVFAHSSRYPYLHEENTTGDFIYLRFHGPGKLFASKYTKKGLQRWQGRIRAWIKQGMNVYAYFNNDMNGYAFMDAASLMELAQNHSTADSPSRAKKKN